MNDDFRQANLFELSGDKIQVTFSATSITGEPLFSYRDSETSMQFRGEEISLDASPLGQLVTVTLEQVSDLRTVTFTLILPVVNVLAASPGTNIEIPGIRATAYTTIVGPRLGQSTTYRQATLSGTAQFVMP